MQDDFQWYNPKEGSFQLSGFAWFHKEGCYRRLPGQPEFEIPERVNELANCTSGGQIRFRTNASKLQIKVKLIGTASMSHMAASGQCGFDIYVGEPGKQQYFATAIPPLHERTYERAIWDFDSRHEMREVTVNFPLYQGVEEVLIGTNQDALIEVPTPYQSDKRVIFYGTSITQGGCASRPGMSYTNILSRRFHLEFINLGFSGSGKGEQGVALTIREIERPACFVIDYEGNVTTEQYKTTLVPFIETYREYHPLVPIIVMSRIPYAQGGTHGRYKDYLERRNHSKSTVEQFIRNGDQNLTFVDGSALLGENWNECTVDGVHPNDFGFMKMAEGLEGIMETVLQIPLNRG
ncbi:SGNH/GDSL hydrolase family protein [Neobacillus niacini]|uniref:SGNH/GDSL hydrolase family protein n=1 Tax=Neobacillus niacini TaxID=86668 RepID=UPI002FFF3223